MSDTSFTIHDALPPDTSKEPLGSTITTLNTDDPDNEVLRAEVPVEAAQGIEVAADEPVVEAPAAVAAPTEAPVTTPEEQVAQAGLDMAQLEAEYAESGALTEDTLKALADKGITKDAVDAYIAGRQALAEAYTNDLAASLGGQAEMQSLFDWAAANLTDGEKAAANAVLASRNADQAKLVLSGLKSRYVAAVGQEPRLVNAASAPAAPSVKPFASPQELARAQQHKLYKSGDKAYHAEIDARLAVSKW